MLRVFGPNPDSGEGRPKLVMQVQIFWCLWCFGVKPKKESISKEMNNDNNSDLHSITKLSGWLRH